jgi:hypothetical protein
MGATPKTEKLRVILKSSGEITEVLYHDVVETAWRAPVFCEMMDRHALRDRDSDW